MKHAFLAGATKGIGFALAKQLVDTGMHVTITGRDATSVKTAVNRLDSPHASGLVLDLHDHEQVRKTFASLERIDHLVLCGSSDVAWGPFEVMTMDALEKALRMKLVGYLHAAQSALPLLDERGSITFVGGTASRAAMPGTVGLAAVNGGLEAATRTLARELAPRRVNLVSPGLTATEAYAAMPEEARTQMFEGAAARLPAGKVGAPDEIADAIRFVILNGFTTGSIIDVDGGAHLGYSAPLVTLPERRQSSQQTP